LTPRKVNIIIKNPIIVIMADFLPLHPEYKRRCNKAAYISHVPTENISLGSQPQNLPQMAFAYINPVISPIVSRTNPVVRHV
jgi:hypothetical protein